MPADRRLIQYGFLIWLIAALGLLNWKLAEMQVDISPLQDDVTAAVTPKTSETEMPVDPARQSLAELSETVSRPLFHPTRRPVVVRNAGPTDASEATGQSPVPAPVQLSRLSLVGLMGTDGKNRRALLRAEGRPFGIWIDEGNEIDGWRLSAIEDNRVLIEKDGGQEELLLHATGQN